MPHQGHIDGGAGEPGLDGDGQVRAGQHRPVRQTVGDVAAALGLVDFQLVAHPPGGLQGGQARP